MKRLWSALKSLTSLRVLMSQERVSCEYMTCVIMLLRVVFRTNKCGGPHLTKGNKGVPVSGGHMLHFLSFRFRFKCINVVVVVAQAIWPPQSCPSTSYAVHPCKTDFFFPSLSLSLSRSCPFWNLTHNSVCMFVRVLWEYSIPDYSVESDQCFSMDITYIACTSWMHPLKCWKVFLLSCFHANEVFRLCQADIWTGFRGRVHIFTSWVNGFYKEFGWVQEYTCHELKRSLELFVMVSLAN